MRQTISGLIAAAAMLAASAAPAMACGWGYPCGPAYVPAVPVYSGCGVCGGWGYGGWGYERLPDPVEQYHRYSTALPQYYYVNQGPTYTGPGSFAPYPVYRQSAVSGPVIYRYRGHAWHAHHGYYWHHRRYSYRYHTLHSRY
ncbi:MAG TPA: hypothetical protein VMU69_21775 [Bradyrhizobium sp.]|nr:hypothetical protein [Bradyrhizobium sp.]